MEDSLMGRTLRDGEYLVREVLGRGGMATVYRAYSRSLETDLAIKVMAPAMAVNLELRDRFHEEARLLSKLFHPNLLTVHFFGEEGEIVYIAMRLVNGGTLRERLTALGGTLDLIGAARLVRGIADALLAAHDVEVVRQSVGLHANKAERITIDRPAKRLQRDVVKGLEIAVVEIDLASI